MDTLNDSIRKRAFLAIAVSIDIVFVSGLFWVNQNSYDLVSKLERHDCDLSKLKN